METATTKRADSKKSLSQCLFIIKDANEKEIKVYAIECVLLL